jgi:hypothetical protein
MILGCADPSLPLCSVLLLVITDLEQDSGLRTERALDWVAGWLAGVMDWTTKHETTSCTSAVLSSKTGPQW